MAERKCIIDQKSVALNVAAGERLELTVTTLIGPTPVWIIADSKRRVVMVSENKTTQSCVWPDPDEPTLEGASCRIYFDMRFNTSNAYRLQVRHRSQGKVRTVKDCTYSKVEGGPLYDTDSFLARLV